MEARARNSEVDSEAAFLSLRGVFTVLGQVCLPPAFGDPQLVKTLILEMLRLQCVQIQQNSSHTETKMTEYHEGFCSIAFGDPQLVEVIVREMLKIVAHTSPGNADAQ